MSVGEHTTARDKAIADPDQRAVLSEPEARFWAKVDASGDCWEWLGARTANGYGNVRIARIYRPAHRVAWEYLVGPIPPGMVIHHQCQNRRCVNPDHLTTTTFRSNVLLGYSRPAGNARKTHCLHGHELSPQNTLIDKRGRRNCRECSKRRAKETEARRRERGPRIRTPRAA